MPIRFKWARGGSGKAKSTAQHSSISTGFAGNLSDEQSAKYCELKSKFPPEAIVEGSLRHLSSVEFHGKNMKFKIEANHDDSIEFSTTSISDSDIKVLDKEILAQRYDENFYLRFLRARHFNFEKTVIMLERYIDWRALWQVDRLVLKGQQNCTEIQKFYPHAYHGVDKLGRPIYIERIGKVDAPNLLKAMSLSNLFRNWIYEYEMLLDIILPACSVYSDKIIEQSLAIIDLSGLNIHHFDGTCRKVLKELMSISQNYYPEILGKMFLINAPSIFQVVWNFIKPLLDEKTVSKISVFGSGDKWRDRVLEFVAPEQLPEFLGGKGAGKDWYEGQFGPWSDPLILEKVAEDNLYVPATSIDKFKANSSKLWLTKYGLDRLHFSVEEKPSDFLFASQVTSKPELDLTLTENQYSAIQTSENQTKKFQLNDQKDLSTSTEKEKLENPKRANSVGASSQASAISGCSDSVVERNVLISL